MPRRDQTGPNGSGPMSGRAMGRCNNGSTFTNSYGYGYAKGNRRGGRGLNRHFQSNSLQEEKAYLEQELARINNLLRDEK